MRAMEWHSRSLDADGLEDLMLRMIDEGLEGLVLKDVSPSIILYIHAGD